eukprot:IDg15325t1
MLRSCGAAGHCRRSCGARGNSRCLSAHRRVRAQRAFWNRCGRCRGGGPQSGGEMLCSSQRVRAPGSVSKRETKRGNASSPVKLAQLLATEAASRAPMSREIALAPQTRENAAPDVGAAPLQYRNICRAGAAASTALCDIRSRARTRLSGARCRAALRAILARRCAHVTVARARSCGHGRVRRCKRDLCGCVLQVAAQRLVYGARGVHAEPRFEIAFTDCDAPRRCKLSRFLTRSLSSLSAAHARGPKCRVCGAPRAHILKRVSTPKS